MAEEEFPYRYVPPVDTNIGLRIDGHIVRSLLGRGGMGAAYLAIHEALARSICVIKLVLAEIARHPMAIARFQMEAQALSMLKHDNIVRLQNFGVLDDGQLYLRFDYIEGKSLDRYVIDQGGRIPLRKAANFVFQLCGALDYAHKLGVIHRDLKPDNLMVEFNPPGSHLKERLKVLDFGIAKVAAAAVEPTGSGAMLGTARFMAPEQATNAAAVSGKADVFSLAQTLYLLLTGTMPWGIPESDAAIYHKQLTQAPAQPPESLVPPAVAKVLLRCLSINPEDRPTMHEFAIELACAIPAEDGLESGTQILEKVVPDWVTSSPHDAQTLPEPLVAIAAGQALRRPPSPVLAALPTGLVSQRFAAQEPPVETRVPQVVVASEIKLATGTPGPLPYAHAELPAVLVSNTFSGLTSQASAPSAQPPSHPEPAPSARPPSRPEPPPMIVLPGTSRPTSSRKVGAVGASALVLAAVVGFAVVRLGSHVRTSGADETSGSARGSGSAPSLAGPADAGADAPKPQLAVAGSPAHLVDAGQLAPGGDSGAVTLHDVRAQGAETPATAPRGTITRDAAAANGQRTPPATDAASSGEPKATKPPPQAQPPVVKKGELAIEVNTWAIIWLNGKQDEAPYRKMVPAGRYRLRIQHEENDETLSVVVRPDETTTVKRNW